MNSAKKEVKKSVAFDESTKFYNDSHDESKLDCSINQQDLELAKQLK